MTIKARNASFISLLILLSTSETFVRADDWEKTVVGTTYNDYVVVNYKELLDDYEDVTLKIEERKREPITKEVINEKRLVIKARARQDSTKGTRGDSRNVEVISGDKRRIKSVDFKKQEGAFFARIKRGDKVVGYYEFGRDTPHKITFTKKE